MSLSTAQYFHILLLCLLTGAALHVPATLSQPQPESLPPEITVTSDTLDFGDLIPGKPSTRSITLTNTGSNLLLAYNLRITNSDVYRVAFPTPPLWLRPDSSVEVQIECMARDTGCSETQIVIESNAGDYPLSARHCGTGTYEIPGLNRDYTLLFPATITGDCIRSPLRIRNTDATAIRLYGIYSEDPDAEYFTLVRTIPDTGIVIQPEELFALVFQFCPEAIRSASATFRCFTDKGIFLIRLAGNGIYSAQPNIHSFALKPANGHVGTPITTSLQVAPPLIPEDSITALQLSLQVPPGSLLLMKALPVNSQYTVNLEQQDHRTGLYNLSLTNPGGQIVGEDLLFLEFFGLSSGKPENLIALSGEVRKKEQDLDQQTEFLNGTILLEGCTVGASGFSRRVRIEGLRITPTSDNIQVRYTAPEGAKGTFSVVDASGQIVHRSESVGNGSPQELRISLDELPAGLYGLQARFAADAFTVPFMHSK